MRLKILGIWCDLGTEHQHYLSSASLKAIDKRNTMLSPQKVICELKNLGQRERKGQPWNEEHQIWGDAAQNSPNKGASERQ